MKCTIDKNIFGKLILKKNGFFPSESYRFLIICGYDFSNKRFLAIDVDNKPTVFKPVYYTVDETCKLMSYSDALEHIDKMLNKTKNSLNKLSELCELGNIEVARLFNRYAECYNQKCVHDNLRKSCSGNWRVIYEREYNALLKGLRRVEKRFHHYFKEQAKSMMEYAIRCGSNGDIVSQVKNMEMRISTIEKYRQTFVDMYKELTKNLLIEEN